VHLTHQLDHLHTAQLRHLLIEHGHVNGPGLDQIQCLTSGTGGDGLDSLRLEQSADCLVPTFLLVGQENREPS